MTLIYLKRKYLQLATSKLQVCSSKGKSARYIPQEHIKETLEKEELLVQSGLISLSQG